MCTASDVANFFVNVTRGDENESMTNMRLNKLLYFAQGWSLARLGRPLFPESIEAWPMGPVVPAIYDKYKYCGKNDISVVDETYSNEVFTDDEYDLIMDVLLNYEDYSTAKLVDMSHAKGAPWKAVFDPDHKVPITIEGIKAWFESQPPLEEFGLTQEEMDKADSFPRNAAGLTILPKEWDDGWEL